MKNKNTKLKKSLIILAGGSGTRLGMDIPKALVKIKEKSIISLSLEILDFITWEQIIVTYPENFLSTFENDIKNNTFRNKISLVCGGKERQQSVLNGLEQLHRTSPPELIMIHDAARPFANRTLISQLIKEYGFPGITPAIKLTDTVFFNDNNKIGNKLDREQLLLIQTPQLFDFQVLYKCHKKLKNRFFTDDSSLVKECGYDIKWIPGDKNNFKITTKEDLNLAKCLK